MSSRWEQVVRDYVAARRAVIAAAKDDHAWRGLNQLLAVEAAAWLRLDEATKMEDDHDDA